MTRVMSSCFIDGLACLWHMYSYILVIMLIVHLTLIKQFLEQIFVLLCLLIFEFNGLRKQEAVTAPVFKET